MTKDYYETLGVSKSSSKDELKKAYKKLAKKYHPDISGDKSTEEKFKEISEAYAVLSDGEKRKMYDQFGHADFNQQFSQEDIFRNVNFQDIFSEIFGSNGGFGGSIFGDLFGAGRGREPQHGEHLRYDLEVDFEEAAFGATKEVRVSKLDSCEECDGSGSSDGKTKTCSTCNGTGQFRQVRQTMFGTMVQQGICPDCRGQRESILNPCKNCRGTGRVAKSKTINLKVPPGVDNGFRLRVKGEGEAGVRGRASGDLFVIIHVRPHNFFKRDDEDIIFKLPVSFPKLALGAKIEVPTLHGKVKLKIPAGTQTGTVFRVRGKGVPRFRGFGNGDQYVKVFTKVPEKLDRKAKKLLEELDKRL